MKTRFLAGLVGLGLLGVPLVSGATPKKHSGMSEDMRQAIAFERHKDMAAARQARIEARHPSVSDANANRSVEKSEQGHKVKDPGPAKKDE
jgi:hypothetical protein